MTDTYEPNRDDVSGRFTPDQPSAPQIDELSRTSALDQVNAAVLEMFPEAASWEALTMEYDDGYYYESPLVITLADGSSQEIGEDELDVNLSDLTSEQGAGENSFVHSLTAYKGGFRTAILPERPEDDDWRSDLAEQIRAAYPDLHKVVLTTELWNNGFFFSTSATGYDADGNESDVDLSEFEDGLTEASEHSELGRNTDETIELAG